MSVHQLLNPFVALDNLLGTATAPGGKLYFYERGTTTPKDTWQDFGKGTSNANPVILDSAGRVPAQVWGDGDYSVKLDAADDSAIVASVEFRDPAPAGSAIPDQSGHSGEFLGTNGTDTAWLPVLQLPDPTGSAGYMPVVNGAGDGYALIPVPTVDVPESNTVVSPTSVILSSGSGERFMIQTGTGTVPSSGSRTSNVNITFPVAFTKVLAVVPMASTYSVNAYGAGATITAAGFTVGSPASGATVTANSVDDGGGSGADILNPVIFTWVAFGLVAAA